MTQKNDIDNLRETIDTIDKEILNLLQERLQCAVKIGHYKESVNKAKRDPEREQQIYERILQENNKVFPEKPLKEIYEKIIETCFLAQK